MQKGRQFDALRFSEIANLLLLCSSQVKLSPKIIYNIIIFQINLSEILKWVHKSSIMQWVHKSNYAEASTLTQYSCTLIKFWEDIHQATN